MQVVMRAHSLCFMGNVGELREFWASLTSPMAQGLTVQAYLKGQLADHN